MHAIARGFLLLVLWCALASAASAQAVPWQTPASGDASDDYLTVELAVAEGDLTGARTVERIRAPGGYTTGSIATVVLSGTESEDARTLRVHLPYGTELDLAVGDAVTVDAHARRMGLGSRYEVLLTRGSDIVLLATSSASVHGVQIARGDELPREGSSRRFGLRVTMSGQSFALVPQALGYLPGASSLVAGSERIYEGTRPPDAFDERIFTMVRIQLQVRAHS
jgi:hypothetical protein